MSRRAVLVFTPAGQGQGLYTELIDLQLLGPLCIERASNIEFDQARQCWEVRDWAGVVQYRAPSRQACLDWEEEAFNHKEDGHR